MYMTNRLKLILIAGGALIILAMTIYGFQMISSRTAPAPVQPTPSTDTTPTTPSTTSTQSNTDAAAISAAKNPAETLKPEESALIAIALPFVERMGSYSNQGGYANLQMLLPFMTASMKQWAQGKIEETNKAGYQPIYTGTTTSVLSYDVMAVNVADAQIKMSTQRKESIGSASNSKVYTQDVEVRMVKEGGVWLVDEVNWK